MERERKVPLHLFLFRFYGDWSCCSCPSPQPRGWFPPLNHCQLTFLKDFFRIPWDSQHFLTAPEDNRFSNRYTVASFSICILIPSIIGLTALLPSNEVFDKSVATLTSLHQSSISTRSHARKSPCVASHWERISPLGFSNYPQWFVDSSKIYCSIAYEGIHRDLVRSSQCMYIESWTPRPWWVWFLLD